MYFPDRGEKMRYDEQKSITKGGRIELLDFEAQQNFSLHVAKNCIVAINMHDYIKIYV